MCEYALQFTSLPEGTEVGSVLNVGITPTTPNGLLVKVTGIDGTSVAAVQATLQDALVQGEFWVERTFSSDQLRGEPTLAPGVTIGDRTTGGGNGGTGRLPTFDALSLPGELTIDVEPVDGVRVTGTLDFGAGCGLDGGVGGSDIAWMEASCSAWESASLHVQSEKEGPASTERYVVALFPLAAFPIPIGPLVIVVVVDILVTIDLSGNVHVGVDYQGREYAKVSGGLKYSLGHGFDHTGGVDTSASSTGGALSGPVSAAALGRAELRLSLYGVLGVSVGGDATIRFEGGPDQNPRWRILANAGVFLKMFLGILSYELSAHIRYSLKQPFEVRSWKNTPPTIAVVWPTNGAVVTLGGLVRKVEASATDAEDGAVPVTWTDLTTGATASGTGQLTIPLTTPGAHTLRVTAVDSVGASAEQTLTVTVKAPGLTLALTLLDADGTELPLPPSGESGSTILVEAKIGSGALLSEVGCADVAWSATNATITPDGSCRPAVRLGQPGTATITATVTDPYGTTADGAVSLNVAAAPATVTPQFRGIDVTTVAGSIPPGTPLLGNTAVRLSVTWLNPDEATVRPVYTWTVTAGGAAPVALPGFARESVTSTRSYTPPSAWGHRATFTVVVTDATTGAVLTTRTREVIWNSLPK